VRRSRQAAASFDVEIAGVATAVPAHRLSQNDAASRAKDLFLQPTSRLPATSRALVLRAE
ncbi:MAG: hypothetical protein ABSA62_10145, partial [Methyloceanibacter sp.]